MMWPFASYPELPPTEVDGKTYDYIVVGGGVGGCVVASLLSEDPNVSVLVLEKGHVKDSMMSRIPLASQDFSKVDELQIQDKRWSEAVPGAQGRKLPLYGVDGMGGASRINGMIWTRGCRGDYAAWVDMGLDEWSWDKVEPYFQSLENALAHPDSKARGHQGPIEITQHSAPFEWTHYMQKAAKKVGLPVERDSNDPRAPAMGYFNLDKTINPRGERVSSMGAFLNKDVAIRRRSHLSVCTGVVASQLELDGPRGVVTGIRFRPSKLTPGRPAEEYFVKARREVILTSGTLITPQLLMLSGIGPRDITQRLKIPLVKELPAVGANLADHVSFPVLMGVPRKETVHLMQNILWGIWHFLLWLFFGTGLLGSGSTQYTIFARTGAINEKTMQVESEDDDGNDNMDASKAQNIPDVEIMIMGMNTIMKAIPKKTPLSLYTTLAQPRSRGRVELASVDPLAHPRVTLPHFNDQRDVESARTAMRFSMRVAEEFQNSGYPYPAPIIFAPGNRPELLAWYKMEPTPSVMPDADPKDTGKTWRDVTDEEIDDYVTHVCFSIYHFAGTCSMSNDESKGVVDQRLRVHGFKNLRIADASVLPRPISVHTMAPTMMISRRCASFIKEDWA